MSVKITEPKLTKNMNKNHDMQIVWRNVVLMIVVHAFGVYGLYIAVTSVLWSTIFFTYFLHIFAGMGVTAGAHRLWAHRSYKAKWQLRIILAAMHTTAFQNDIYEWARDHRVHHKFSETDADPHNAKRGFFFSHIGWLLCKKHPNVIAKGKSLDLSDVADDPIVHFQRRFYLPLGLSLCFIIPSYVPYIFWNESLWNSVFINFFRYAWALNMTWLVNSAAHMWGNRPYDNTISPRENRFVIMGTYGEGYHNYHHTFPWDYRATEFVTLINWPSLFIKFFSRVGWAYDLRTVDKDMIEKRIQRTRL